MKDIGDTGIKDSDNIVQRCRQRPVRLPDLGWLNPAIQVTSESDAM